MKTTFECLLRGFILIALMGGCSTTYEPRLIMPPSALNRSIDANVEVHSFIASEDLVSGHSTYGLLAEDYVNKPPSQLTQALTDQVVEELSAQQVFRKVSLYDPQPDLMLTGRIDRYFEHDRRKLWSLVPYYSDKLASLFRVNSYQTDGEVRLTMMLLKPNGELVGSYTGRSKFNEDYTPNSEVRPGDRLNRALGKAVAQIRDEMLADSSLPKTRKPGL
ncbi:MAG: exported protein of unknown function [Nitrospira sp.]|nr:exported protein of unknown function [Nitrospira sp.]